jgi:membrane protein HdeD
MKETTWSKLRELWAIRRRCRQIEREENPSSGATNPLLPRLIFGCLSICFLAACALHVRDMCLHGWLPYHHAPLPLNCFWTALAVLDLIAAIFLFTRPRLGLILSMVITCTDVAVNLWARFDLHLIRHTQGAVLLLLQMSFLAVISAAASYAMGKRPSQHVH